MALVNNFFELRSDAFKITVHNRRPIPSRTDTIGPWLDTLSFLTWLAALTNSALVYLFCPRSQSYCSAPSASTLDKVHQHIISAAGAAKGAEGVDGGAATRELLWTALLIALVASHGYFALRAFVRHVMEKALWHASVEVRAREAEEREVKERFFTGLVGTVEVGANAAKLDVGVNGRGVEGEEIVVDANQEEGLRGFWDHDEGVQEIQRLTKEA
jgi:hypothetical protein